MGRSERQSIEERTNRPKVQSGTRHQMYYFRRVIGQISKRSNVVLNVNLKHEETFVLWRKLLGNT